ncbi:hypothetical protein [Spirochaeta isovalerica]|uniref:Lipoprotein n=1 Tax=Spirochaeta isovalerica TaxID=150 RepID=A0A841RDA5_9SPIO|nr:hypothetical protein [Spirochaeta isovalerica]MBB6481217.1 hypothetical protein [Spirochaeta isovalerica]
MKRMIILLFLFSLCGALCAISDRELITDIEEIVDESLSLFNRLGKTGTEVIRGAEGGTITYRTELTGFNRVLNTVEYEAFCRRGYIISGTISNRTDWSGSGTSLSSFAIEGIESFCLEIEMSLLKKKRIEGNYCLKRENCEPIYIAYDSPD